MQTLFMEAEENEKPISKINMHMIMMHAGMLCKHKIQTHIVQAAKVPENHVPTIWLVQTEC